ncbi:MAG: hypothetical protein H8E57_08165 [Candidatus Cloacimonetes bacterium]|nr:hypothetical protein [Candidatus Cloacimonadota bacterium]
MDKIQIKNVSYENIKDLIDLCIPPQNKDDRYFLEGSRVKKKWAENVLEKYGSFAKIAYLDSRPAGMLQYLPIPTEKIIKIKCVFVPQKENTRKGLAKLIIEDLINDMKKPKSYFDNNPPNALIVEAFEVYGPVFPQAEFFKKMGFEQVSEDNPFLLYYPILDGFVYKPETTEFITQDEDKGKAVIFFDPSCPFGVYFFEEMMRSILEIAPEIPIRKINEFAEREEVAKRGKKPFCAVNGKAITTFFFDKENFQKEVREALR